jgi:hypothetical protein
MTFPRFCTSLHL